MKRGKEKRYWGRQSKEDLALEISGRRGGLVLCILPPFLSFLQIPCGRSGGSASMDGAMRMETMWATPSR
jgi:hypothetical protein